MTEELVDENTVERGKHENTHDAQFVPRQMTVVHDPEWDATHITFEGPDGIRYRVHHDEWRYVCVKPESEPKQPAAGWIIQFENGMQYFRVRDGLWYRCNAAEGATGWTWTDLWNKYGTAHHTILCPVREGALPFQISDEGPVGSVVLPEMVDGNPDLGSGHVSFMDEDDNLVIRQVKTNKEVKLSGDTALQVFAMFVRTHYSEARAAQSGNAQDIGTEVIDIPEV